MDTPTESPGRDNRVPRVAFFGFCDRAEDVTLGNVLFWNKNVLGISHSRAFFVFPVNLRDLKLLVGIFQPKVGDSYKFVFRHVDGVTSFDLTMAIHSLLRFESHETEVRTLQDTEIPPDIGWVLVAQAVGTDVTVTTPGDYKIYLVEDEREQYVGKVLLAHVWRPADKESRLAGLPVP